MEQRKAGEINLALLICFLLPGAFLPAQAQTSEISVGNPVRITSCAKGEKTFRHIDVYFKSLVTDTVIPVDSTTGEGLYESFFVKGSEIDGKRLPCSYGNRSYRVAALHEFMIKGAPQRIMFLYTSKPNELIWVVFDKAVEEKEITW